MLLLTKGLHISPDCAKKTLISISHSLGWSEVDYSQKYYTCGIDIKMTESKAKMSKKLSMI